MTTPASPPRLASLEAFRVWPGVVVDDDQVASAEAVLDAASQYVRLESGNPDRWPDEQTIPGSIRTVTVQVAARVWRNPTCELLSTDGPFSSQWGQAVADALYLSEVERQVVAKVTARPKLWSQPTYRDDDGQAGPVFDTFSGEWIPSTPYPSPATLLGGEWSP